MKIEPTEALKIIDFWGFYHSVDEEEYIDIDNSTKAVNTAFKEGQSNPKIKQLEWDNIYSNHYVKDNPIGYRARINEWNISERDISNKKYVLTLAHSKQENARLYDTLEEAKAFAQKDFEARVKECLIIE